MSDFVDLLSYLLTDSLINLLFIRFSVHISIYREVGWRFLEQGINYYDINYFESSKTQIVNSITNKTVPTWNLNPLYNRNNSYFFKKWKHQNKAINICQRIARDDNIFKCKILSWKISVLIECFDWCCSHPHGLDAD